MKKYNSSLDEEIICVSYNDTKNLPIDLHTNKYKYIKYEIEEVLKRQDNIEYMITDSKTTRNLLKEVVTLKARNNKAIEYINTHYLNANEPELLNILQGDENND